jgi:hypothetical protein
MSTCAPTLPDIGLCILLFCKQPSQDAIQFEPYLYLINYLLNVKKTQDFNMQLVFPERLMVDEVACQNFIKVLPEFFQSGLCQLLNEIVFSDKEVELITKKLKEFAKLLIEQFQPPK